MGNNLKTCNNVIDHHKSDTEIEIFLTQQKYLLQGTKKTELQAWFRWAASSRGYFLPENLDQMEIFACKNSVQYRDNLPW